MVHDDEEKVLVWLAFPGLEGRIEVGERRVEEKDFSERRKRISLCT